MSAKALLARQAQTLWLCWALAAFSPWAAAQTIRLNDSASPRQRVESQSVLSESGKPLRDDINAHFAVIKFGTIDYVLATSPYQGRNARIYYVAPTLFTGLRDTQQLRLSWRGAGAFAHGQAGAGQRALVWSGKVNGVTLRGGIELSLTVPLANLLHPEYNNIGFESYFELELLP